KPRGLAKNTCHRGGAGNEISVIGKIGAQNKRADHLDRMTGEFGVRSRGQTAIVALRHEIVEDGVVRMQRLLMFQDTGYEQHLLVRIEGEYADGVADFRLGI